MKEQNRRRNFPTLVRVFIGTIEISGNYSALAEGLRSNGHSVTAAFSEPHPFGYGLCQPVPKGKKYFKWLETVIRRRLKTRLIKTILLAPIFIVDMLSNAVVSLFWAAKMIRTHDVFIFGFGSSLLRGNIDMVILRILRRKTVISYLGHGSEARPPVVDGAWLQDENDFLSTQKLKELTSRNRRRVKRHERFADVVIGDPLSSTPFASRRMVSNYVLGRPMVLSTYQNVRRISALQSDKGPTIVHAPSHAPCKGTMEIERILGALEDEGFSFTYRRIQDLPNSEVLEILAGSDLVIDQMYSDRYWSKVGAEAGALGKPVLVGGYGFTVLEKTIAPGLKPPVFWCHPDDFESRLRGLLGDPNELLGMGAKAREFVKETYRAEQVAKRWEVLFSPDTIPSGWFFEPEAISYVAGTGQHIDKSIRNYRVMVSRFGLESLGFGHKKSYESVIQKTFLDPET